MSHGRRRALSLPELDFLRRHDLMDRSVEEGDQQRGAVGPAQTETEKTLFAAVGRLTKDVADLDKDEMYRLALRYAETENSVEAALAWLERTVPISDKVAADFTDVVFDKDKQGFEALRKAFKEDDRRLEAMHKAFGGRSGLSALRSILVDVCRGSVAELKQFADAMEG